MSAINWILHRIISNKVALVKTFVLSQKSNMFLLILVYSYFTKIVIIVLRVLKIGNGTTWPGLFFEKWFPGAVKYLVNKDCKIILISGTNGKTTTRSMIVKIIEDQNIEVCTNRGGANIFRGVAAALLANLTLFGQLKAKNIVLEVEEATMPILTKYIKPSKIILTNIFRDQMDAYGEIDTTLQYFTNSLDNLKNTYFELIINKNDKKLLSILNKPRPNINLIGYGIDDANAILPDYESSENNFNIEFQNFYEAKNSSSKNLEVIFDIEKISDGNYILRDKSEFNIADFLGQSDSQDTKKSFRIKTNLLGVYNIYNILAAFVTCFEDFETEDIINSLETVPPVFGRGEKILLPNGSQIIMFLVKNPAGMNQVFELIKANFDAKDLGLNFLINDNVADGRDVSWLWDCNFEDLIVNLHPSVQFQTSGTRGLDILLRLETAGADVTLRDNYNSVLDLVSVINQKQNFKKVQLVLATYTAMLEFRSELGKFVELQGIGGKGN
jgi:lipid II isoglutaminyl synthase (glutamine-hydrolysing)